MPARKQLLSPTTALIAVIAVAAAIAGCGGGKQAGNSSQGGGTIPASGPVRGVDSAHRTCEQTVLDVLVRVAQRVYRQGVSSERTRTAARLIAQSGGLREAVEKGDAAAATAAARGLVAGGHMTNLRVSDRSGRLLADVGGPAVTPRRGTITGVGHKPVGSYVTSVWSDEGLLAETNGLTGGRVALRVKGHSVGGSLALPPGRLAPEGTLTYGGQRYRYASFPATVYPEGALRIYLLKSNRSAAALCGRTTEDTVVNTLSRIANLIYAGEGGPRTLPQIRRVQADQALVQATEKGDPRAARKAIEALLTEHIVRLRLSAGAKLLADVGGPYVLAPVTAPLRSGGRTVGSFVLSIQDDEGYLRLTRRLAGLRVLMYMNPSSPQLVKNSLGPSPGKVPASGAYEYGGRRYRVFTINARAFPSQPLTIRVLVPIPYS